MNRASLVLIPFLAISASAAAAPPRNVIFFVGDGMGAAHVTLLRSLRGDQINIGRMRLAALHFTASADHAVTDSGAGATAFACGVKTNSGALGVDAAGTPQPTILEAAEKLGMATGVVTTTAFFDATPAAFLVHVKDRRESLKIVNQMLGSGAEVIAGAGLEAFGKKELPAIETLAKAAGYSLVRSKSELAAAASPRTLAVLPTQPHDLDQPDLPLPDLTRWAISRLKGDPDGFFLVVEHEGIDTSSHQNDSADVAASLTSFDKAVGIALDFAAADGKTLVIVTGDHETGGLRLSEFRDGKLRTEWSTVEHTAVAIPLFMSGPGSDEVNGLIDNTEIGKALFRLLRAKKQASGR
jgi:alkaline phosphatase